MYHNVQTTSKQHCHNTVLTLITLYSYWDIFFINSVQIQECNPRDTTYVQISKHSPIIMLSYYIPTVESPPSNPQLECTYIKCSLCCPNCNRLQSNSFSTAWSFCAESINHSVLRLLINNNNNYYYCSSLQTVP